MQTKPIGIGKNIKKGLSNPKKTADLLAKKIVQTIWSTTHSNDIHSHHSLSPMARIAHATLRLKGEECTKQAREAARASLADTIELILLEYKGEEVDKTIEISTELKKMVAKAVLELLGAEIERKGFHELAHILHHEENTLQLLHNPIRLRLLDRGVIYANPQGVNRQDEGASQLWAGHTTLPEFRKNGDRGTNIYMEVQPDGSVIPLLEGEQIISTVIDEVLVVTSETLAFHKKPSLAKGRKTGFNSEKLFETPNTIGKFRGVRPVPVSQFVKWNGYEIQGDEGKGNIIVCIRTKENEKDNSFASSGRIFTMNNSIFVLENDGFYILGETGKEKREIAIDTIIGPRKLERGEPGIYFTSGKSKQKIVVREEKVLVEKITRQEQEFFEKKK